MRFQFQKWEENPREQFWGKPIRSESFERKPVMEDHSCPRVANYFVVAGLNQDSRPLEEEIQSEGQWKPPRSLAPITDVAIIIRGQGEKPPAGFTVIETTPSGIVADLNHGSIGSSSIFLCYKRGFDKLPLTDIGILHEGKERVMSGCEIVSTTPNGNPANVNTRIGVGTQRAYLTYRRASETSPHNSLAVIDICVILTNKGETPPHAFCLINKNLNKGSMVGSDVYLCYKKSAVRGNSLAYQSGMLSRYPLVDDEEFPLPESIARFCMPLGATIECWSTARHHPLPIFSTFVLTDSLAAKIYGAAVTFYEGYPEEKLTSQQHKDLGLKTGKKNNVKMTYSVHTNKCVCLLSRWPFFEAFKKFLTFIYRLSISGPHTIPIERHIAHFLSEVPFPTPQRPRILMELGHDSLILAQPQTSPMPLSGASFCAMLRNLAPDNSMNMLAFVLLEHKLLLHSLRPALLTGVAEAVASMIFPLMWQCPYIPLCPLSLSTVINAPLPVIAGVDSRYFDMYEPPTDATCLDIDTNSILHHKLPMETSVSEEKKPITWKFLPKKPAKRLHSTLNKLYYELCESGIGDGVSDEQAVEVAPLEVDFNRKKKQLQMEHKIQEAFLTFMASTLKGYSQNLLPITQQPNHRVTDASARFDYPGFMKTREKPSHPFFKQFLRTQMFIKFIEERSFISGNDERFAFFDECIDKLDADSREEVQLIDVEDQKGSEHTVFVTPPDANGYGNEEYIYDKFPILRPELYNPAAVRKQSIKTPASSRGLRGSGQQSSPFPRRTKHEIRNSQKMAKQQAASPEQWASFLLGQCYALWFLHLPSYVKATHSKTRALRTAFEILKRMQAQELQLADEACYRVLMQLCGQYSQPVLAVQVYMEMKRRGIEPNAITYGFYNMAVLESTWPASGFSGYQQWVKLRNTLRAVTLFRRGLNHRRSIYSDTSSEVDVGSGSSGDSGSSDPLPDGGRGDDLIQLMSSQAANLTREEKSSTGNSDMGYSSMIMDESAPNEVLASPELSPIRFGVKKIPCSVGDVKDVADGVDKKEEEDGVEDHSQDTLTRRDKGDVNRIKHDIAEVIGPRSAASTPVNHSQAVPIDSSSKPNSNEPSDQLDGKGTGDSGTSIVRHSRSSNGSTGSMGTLQGSTGSPGLVLNGPISLENSVDETVFEAVDAKEPNTDSNERRRHRSADHSFTIPMPGSLHKRNKSGDTNSPYGLSLSSQGSIDRESNVSMELFGSDAKILAGITDDESSIATSPLGGRTSSIHSRPSPTLVEVTHVPRSYSVGSRPEFPSHRTPNGSVPNKDHSKLSDQIKVKHSERTVAAVPAKDCKKDLLISFDEENLGESKSNHEVLTNHERTSSKNQNSTDLLDLGMETERDCKVNSIEKDLVDLRTDWNDTIAEENSEEVAAEDAINSRTEQEEDEEGNLEEASASHIFHGDNLDSNSSRSGSRDSLDSNKDKATPRKGSLFSGISGFTPRINRQSLTKTLSNASTQMETLGTAFKARTMGFATKLGEYTRSFSSPAAPKLIPNRNSAMGSLNSLEGMDEPSEMASSWNDSVMDNISLGNMGIHLPGSSLAGSCQSLNQPGQDSEDAGIRRHAIEVHVTSCYQCFNCHALLYDEAVMAGWSADESNLKTRCCFCTAQLVPFLNIAMQDFRHEAAMPVCTITPSPSTESVQSIHSAPLIKRKDSSQIGEETVTKKQSESIPSVDNLSEEEEDAEDEEEEQDGKDGNLPSTVKLDQRKSLVKQPVVPSLSAGEVTLHGELQSARMSPMSTRRRSSSECMTITDMAAKGQANGGRAMTLPRCKPIEEFRDFHHGYPANSAGSLASSMRNSMESMPPPSKESKVGPISVPYLSPLVLRKEVENVIENEGEACLRAPSFVVQHPIIFWNLIWYFQRLNFPNYLQGVLLAAYSDNRDNDDCVQWLSADSRYVKISVLWDNVKLYDDSMLPMYLLWGVQGNPSLVPLIKDQQIFSKPFMVQLVKYIRYNNVYQPIVLLLEELKKLGENTTARRSIYRELLFLSFVAMGRENIDQDAFDQQYRQAFYKLEKENGPFGRLLVGDDKPPPLAVQMCRKAFGDLLL